jgi:hypothetical protein
VGRRPLLVIAGWLGAALLATAVGLGAISVIGAGLTSSGGERLSEADVARELAAAASASPAVPGGAASTPAPAPASTSTPGSAPPASDGTGDSPAPVRTSPSAAPAGTATTVPSRPRTTSPSRTTSVAGGPSVPGAARTFATRGGTVTARCVGSQVEIVSMSPVQGYAVHERATGPRDDAEGEFRSTGDGHDRVKVDVRCRSGAPVIEVRSETGDG